MDRIIKVDIFVEDRAHEDFIVAMTHRLAREAGKSVDIRVRSARGGHGRVLSEFDLYQKSVNKGIGSLTRPDFLIVAIDANCQRFQAAQKAIQDTLTHDFRDISVIACPDPHIERWYLADKSSFAKVIGASPKMGKRKCERDYYKVVLSQTVINAGHVPTLGGIEFAREIIDAMDVYRAGKAEKSLKASTDSLTSYLRRL
jgi:F420-dependent methylenetetrahydromethanopterin dehydrogenase